MIHRDTWKLHRPDIIVLLAMGVLCWLSRYWLSSAFGLYEDDYARIPPAMALNASEIPGFVIRELRTFGQGRPLHAIFIGLLAWLGNQIHGLAGMYWLGYAISVANAWLFYSVLLRIESGRTIAAASALALAVYPADASQAFLTHAFGVHASLSLVLLAAHCTLSGRRVVSALLLGAALLCYETPVVAFAAFPLLLPRWDTRRGLQHAGTVAALIAIVAVGRAAAGEYRVTELQPGETVFRMIHQMSVGPAVGLTSYIWRAWSEASHFDWLGGILAVAGAAVAGYALWQSGRVVTPGTRAIRLMLGGAVWLVLSYALGLTVDAGEYAGRASRIHYAGSVGAAIVIGSLVGWLAQSRGRLLAGAAMALLAGSSVLGGVAVQRDQTLSWRYQQMFWKEVTELCPDLRAGQVILLDHHEQWHETRHLRVFEWHLPLVMMFMYWMPESSRAPELWAMKPGWRQYLSQDGLFLGRDVLEDPLAWIPERQLSTSDLIVLDAGNGRLERRSPIGPVASLRPGVLYSTLIGSKP